MDEILNSLSWWQMPLSALGDNVLSVLGSVLGFALILGLFAFFVRRL